jgi:hypothetical protein
MIEKRNHIKLTRLSLFRCLALFQLDLDLYGPADGTCLFHCCNPEDPSALRKKVVDFIWAHRQQSDSPFSGEQYAQVRGQCHYNSILFTKLFSSS